METYKIYNHVNRLAVFESPSLDKCKEWIEQRGNLKHFFYIKNTE